MQFDEREIARIVREQSDELLWFHAIAGVRRALRWRARPAFGRTICLGLMRVVSGRRIRQGWELRRLPFGWRRHREWYLHRDTWLEGPWWLLALVIVKRSWRRWAYLAAMRLGVWVDVPDGGYFHEGRWRWQRRAGRIIPTGKSE